MSSKITSNQEYINKLAKEDCIKASKMALQGLKHGIVKSHRIIIDDHQNKQRLKEPCGRIFYTKFAWSEGFKPL